jgi:hypothetical protein
MALGFSTESRGSGDILPIVKFDAKGGDWIAQDRVQGADGTWGKQENELATPFKFVADIAAMEVGYLSFASGAPDFHMVKLGETMPARPSEEHKQAIRFRLLIQGESGPREFSHSAKTVLRVIDALHDHFEAEKHANAGKVPVIEAGQPETVKVQSPQGELRFKAPVLNIVGWVDRPAALDGAAQEPAPAMVAPQVAATPPATPAGADLF